MENNFTLSALSPNESAYVKELTTKGDMRQRLMQIGLSEGTRVTCLSRAPSGDPAAYLIRGAVIAIRRDDAKEVILSLPKESLRG